MNQTNPRRHTTRMKGYDYALPGAYFVTMVTQHRLCFFGEVVSPNILGETISSLSEYGEIVQYTWQDLLNHNSGLELDAFVVMPNHVHGIIVINELGLVGDGSEPSVPTK
jgi:putative transposase